MEEGKMVAKGSREAPSTLSGLANSVDPTPGDGTAPAPAPRRLPHLHKLEKKLSSSDLHSRLKTRKVLGVGETDDGDIHRSKLSQILGHSDQLYVRFPWGLRAWQFVLAVSFTVASLWALVFPSQIFDVALEEEEAKYVTLPVRLYGTALLALSLFHWNTIYSTDRDVIRVALLSSVIYYFLQTIVTLLTMVSWTRTADSDYTWLLGSRLTAALIGGLYYHAVGCKTVSLKPKPSSKDSCE